MKNGRKKIINNQISKLDTKVIEENLDEVLNKLDFAAKIKSALGCILRNVKMGEYRFCHTKENTTLKKKMYSL